VNLLVGEGKGGTREVVNCGFSVERSQISVGGVGIFSRKVVDFRSVGWSFSAGSAGRGAWRGVALGVQGWRRRMAKMGAKEGCNKVKKIVANHKINNKAVI